MARLIDANALMNVLEKLLDERQKEADFTGSRCVNIGWDDAIYHIKSAPTVDAVEVVRCKECKHRVVNEHYGEKGYIKVKAYCELERR